MATQRPRRRHDPGLPYGAVVPPGPSTVDLHAHSTRSDGVLPPAELLRQVAAAGVRTFSLTDHDTLAGYRDVAAADAVPAGVTLIPGVEINALVTRHLGLWEAELHILGFGMDPANEPFEATLAAQRGARRIRFERTVARALIAAGYASSVEDAFSRLIGHGGPGYVRREGLGPEAAIAAIRDAGGIPVLAHFREAPSRLDVVQELVDAGLAGLEVYYRSFDLATVAAIGAVADDLGLIRTGGSDYHGDTGTYAESHAALWVPPEVGARLLERASLPVRP